MSYKQVTVAALFVLVALVTVDAQGKKPQTQASPPKFSEFIQDPAFAAFASTSVAGIAVSARKGDGVNFVEGNPAWSKSDGSFNTVTNTLATAGLGGLSYAVYRKNKTAGRVVLITSAIVRGIFVGKDLRRKR